MLGVLPMKLNYKNLLAIEAMLDRINPKLEQAMATAEQFQTLLAEIDAETTRIATKIEELVAKILAGGMSAADEDATKAELQTAVDRLKTIGTEAPPEPT